jgi:hypothetical protein
MRRRFAPWKAVIGQWRILTGFGVKKQARVACHPSYRRAPQGECFEAKTSRIIRVA